MKPSKIIFASDFKGIDLREKLFAYANQLNIEVEDIGISDDSPLDFVDVTKQLALKMSSPDICGVLICGNGHGMAMAANKFDFIRAVVCFSKRDAENARRKLDANVLCFGYENISLEEASDCLGAFVSTQCNVDKYGKTIEKLGSFATSHAAEGVNLIVRGVITLENHVLLSTTTRHNREYGKDLYFLPGGHVDYNESAISALKRELFEEMNLQVENPKFIGALECSWNKKGDVYHELNLVYQVDVEKLSLNSPPQSSEPFIEFVWCPIKHISEYHILPDQLNLMLQEVGRAQNRTVFYSQMIQSI